LRVRRVLIALVAMIVCAAVTLGVVSGLFGSIARSGLYATGLLASNGPSTRSSDQESSSLPSTSPDGPSPGATRTPPAPEVDLPAPVLAAAEPGAVPDPAAVSARIAKVRVKGMGSGYTGAVLDVGSGRTLFAHNRTKAYIPASTMKLLTSAAALSILGPERTFATKVVSGPGRRIILVGGGDPYLESKADDERASLADLARSAAAALRKQKVRKVSLGYDDSLFSGPRWNPTWPSGYGDVVTPISALWVDEGRVGGSGARVANPSKKAAEVFAAALRKQGIAVSSVAARRASSSAKTLASVSSMPLDRIVERLLMVSDNDAAEVVFRQAAVGAKKKASFVSSAEVVEARLRKLGVWARGTEIHDGSGLSRETHVSADTMAKVLRLAAQDQHPELRGVITGLPVAGVEGSLRSRYYDDQGLPGRGVVRGKTGTLRKVHSLAGFVRARDGSMLVYAFLVNNPKNEFAARVWLEHVSAALSTCGCR
jgi:D-alanyl-D-alanine carboxypeptidase/D-alanyl-D-alanine-endopeptidase (penicillin-binding protein 4)